MSEENAVVVTQNQQQASQMFGRSLAGSGAVNHGSVQIEQERAIAEAQGQLVLAKKFPRDMNEAFAEIVSACKQKGLAAVAFYTVPRAGSKVTGPSIRLAEEIARVYGNFQYGHRELSRSDTKSEVEVYAWDMEKNNRSVRQLTVMHTRDTRDGQMSLRDQKDIDDKIANVASKQVRGRILALVPKWFVETAIEECRKTIAGDNKAPIEQRIRDMVIAFGQFGVTVHHLESYLGHPLDKTLPDELADLTGVYNAIREGGNASDYFGADAAQAEGEPKASTAAAIASATKETKPAEKAPRAKATSETGAEPTAKQAPAKTESKHEPAPKVKQEPEPAKTEPEPEPQTETKIGNDESSKSPARETIF